LTISTGHVALSPLNFEGLERALSFVSGYRETVHEQDNLADHARRDWIDCGNTRPDNDSQEFRRAALCLSFAFYLDTVWGTGKMEPVWRTWFRR
jgi:hypothetical protein